MEPEKNDVDINALFNWGRKLELENFAGEVEATVYMRLLGDADVNRTRVYALRKSAELRKELSDKNSDLRWATIKDIDAISEEDLSNMIVIFSMREIQNSAIKNVDIPYPKTPKANAKLAVMEKFQKEVDDYPSKRRDAVEKYIKKEVDKLKDFLKKEPKEKLYDRYVNTLIDEFCEREALRAYADMELYLGCYKDEAYTEKFFPSFEYFDNLPEEQKVIFKSAYSKLTLDITDLKKLREATL